MLINRFLWWAVGVAGWIYGAADVLQVAEPARGFDDKAEGPYFPCWGCGDGVPRMSTSNIHVGFCQNCQPRHPLDNREMTQILDFLEAGQKEVTMFSGQADLYAVGAGAFAATHKGYNWCHIRDVALMLPQVLHNASPCSEESFLYAVIEVGENDVLGDGISRVISVQADGNTWVSEFEHKKKYLGNSSVAKTIAGVKTLRRKSNLPHAAKAGSISQSLGLNVFFGYKTKWYKKNKLHCGMFRAEVTVQCMKQQTGDPIVAASAMVKLPLLERKELLKKTLEIMTKQEATGGKCYSQFEKNGREFMSFVDKNV